MKDSELGVATSTRFLLWGEFEDQVVGTVLGSRFYQNVCIFYETAVCKIIGKFPFNETVFNKLLMLGTASRLKLLMCLTLQIGLSHLPKMIWIL